MDRTRRILQLPAALMVLAIAQQAHASHLSCESALLTPDIRAREAAAVSAATHRTVAPRRIDYLLKDGAWKMVWTTPPQEQRDVYLFRHIGTAWTLVGRWHGDLGTDDPQAGLDWAAARHVPTNLASCFGTVLVNHP